MNQTTRNVLAFGAGVLLAVFVSGILAGCDSAESVAKASNKSKAIIQRDDSVLAEPTKVILPASEEITPLGAKYNGAVAAENKSKTVRRVTIPASRTIEIYGEVADNAIDAANTIAALNAKSHDPIFIVLTSPGGSVIHGAQLIAAMQSSAAPVHTICKTLCASMAFMIFEYGKKRYATDRTILMAHPAAAGAQGRVDNMMNFVGLLQRYTGKLEHDVATRMGLSFEQYKNKVVNEYWVDSEDGLKDNVVDELISINVNQDSPIVNLMGPPPPDQDKLRKPLTFDIKWIM
jgi:ATP-dependent protease ClpP protease subunit